MHKAMHSLHRSYRWGKKGSIMNLKDEILKRLLGKIRGKRKFASTIDYSRQVEVWE